MTEAPQTNPQNEPQDLADEITYASEQEVAQFVFRCCLMEAHIFSKQLGQEPVETMLGKQESLKQYLEPELDETLIHPLEILEPFIQIYSIVSDKGVVIESVLSFIELLLEEFDTFEKNSLERKKLLIEAAYSPEIYESLETKIKDLIRKKKQKKSLMIIYI